MLRRAMPIAYAALFLLLVVARRHEQVFHPDVWVEEGPFVLKPLIDDGPLTLFQPVNGYLILVPKLISWISLSLSFSHYALIGTVMACLFAVAVATLVSTSPLKVKGGWALGAITLLVPSDPEVFGIALYTFWWASLLIFAVTLWDERSHDIKRRIIFVLMGGLSSPVIVMALPLFWLRAALYRKTTRERIVAGVATLCAILQGVTMLRSLGGTSATESLHELALIIPKFLGGYAVGNFGSLPIAALFAVGIAMAIFMFAAFWQQRHDPTSWFLAYLWVGSIALSATRAPLSLLSQDVNGPRYFFFPFVLQSWFFVHLLFSNPLPLLRAVAGALVVLSVANAAPVFTRPQTDLHWRAQARNCPFFAQYLMLVQYDGTAPHAWDFPLTGAQCRMLAQRDPFKPGADAFRPSPFMPTPFDRAHLPTSLATVSSITANGWLRTDGHDFYDFTILISRRTSDADEGSITVHIHQGEQILYRSGPSIAHQYVRIEGTPEKVLFSQELPDAGADWWVLQFSSELLPQTFDVTFVDDGSGWGEWSAVALKHRHR